MIKVDIHKTLRARGGNFTLQMALSIPEGSLLTLYGPSGSGKTSFLRCLAGLLTPDQGTILVGDHTWFDGEKKIHLPPQKRNTGYVFQDNALFPNMTVVENMKFALRKSAPPGFLDELLQAMDLQDLMNRFPDSLSGGQRQRASLARALAQKPDILLLDEPLAALDAEMRFKLQDYIVSSHKRFGITTIMVSHDLAEIITLSDMTVVMQEGKIAKTGRPEEVFMEKRLSGKFQFTGTLLKLEAQDVVYIASVLIGNNIVKVVVHPSETEGFSPGDKVVVASKAFNPVIYKIGQP